jgi:hypothetical protein
MGQSGGTNRPDVRLQRLLPPASDICPIYGRAWADWPTCHQLSIPNSQSTKLLGQWTQTIIQSKVCTPLTGQGEASPWHAAQR